jgi:hypothetical protein
VDDIFACKFSYRLFVFFYHFTDNFGSESGTIGGKRGNCMVIHSNMSPKAVIEIWGNTLDVFKNYSVPISGNPLNSLVHEEKLPQLLEELNQTIGSPVTGPTEGN